MFPGDPFPACRKTAIVSIYRSDVVGRHEDKIRFVLFPAETHEFVSKYYAYAKPEVEYICIGGIATGSDSPTAPNIPLLKKFWKKHVVPLIPCLNHGPRTN